MTETTASDRSLRTSPRLSSVVMTPGRIILLVACAVLILIIAIWSYTVIQSASIRDNNMVQQLQASNRTLAKENADQRVQLADLQAKLAKIQAALNAINPSENTYEISPNQSMIVADGRLTIGLVGAPSNDSVNLNINGRQYSAVAGDVINFTLDLSTTCRVMVRSFDVSNAVVNATCTPVKT